MYNAENLQEKWAPVLNHDGLQEIKDPYRKSVTAILLENQERALREERAVLTEAPTNVCLLYTSPSPRDNTTSRMPSSA